MYPNELEAMPYNVFAFIQPKVAVFTTPNADFNVLFENFDGRRHWDHKFEWTREQFSEWYRKIIIFIYWQNLLNKLTINFTKKVSINQL